MVIFSQLMIKVKNKVNVTFWEGKYQPACAIHCAELIKQQKHTVLAVSGTGGSWWHAHISMETPRIWRGGSWWGEGGCLRLSEANGRSDVGRENTNLGGDGISHLWIKHTHCYYWLKRSLLDQNVQEQQHHLFIVHLIRLDLNGGCVCQYGTS